MAGITTFRYVLHNEGRRWALKWAFDCWIEMPWQDIRIKVAEIILSLLRVNGYFDYE